MLAKGVSLVGLALLSFALIAEAMKGDQNKDEPPSYLVGPPTNSRMGSESPEKEAVKLQSETDEEGNAKVEKPAHTEHLMKGKGGHNGDAQIPAAAEKEADSETREAADEPMKGSRVALSKDKEPSPSDQLNRKHQIVHVKPGKSMREIGVDDEDPIARHVNQKEGVHDERVELDEFEQSGINPTGVHTPEHSGAESGDHHVHSSLSHQRNAGSGPGQQKPLELPLQEKSPIKAEHIQPQPGDYFKGPPANSQMSPKSPEKEAVKSQSEKDEEEGIADVEMPANREHLTKGKGLHGVAATLPAAAEKEADSEREVAEEKKKGNLSSPKFKSVGPASPPPQKHASFSGKGAEPKEEQEEGKTRKKEAHHRGGNGRKHDEAENLDGI